MGVRRSGSVFRHGWLLACLLALSNLAWSLDFYSGDFQQILRSRSDSLTVWQYADNPNIYVFDFPGLSHQGRSFNRVTQFTEQQFMEPYPKVLTDADWRCRLMIMVRFFDTVAERVGIACLEVDYADGMILKDLVGRLKVLYPQHCFSYS